MATVNPKPIVGDINTIVQINMSEDLSGASALKVKYLKPDLKSIGEVNGFATGVGNKILQATLPVLDQEGDWIFVPYADSLGSWSGHGNSIRVHVFGIYEVFE